MTGASDKDSSHRKRHVSPLLNSPCLTKEINSGQHSDAGTSHQKRCYMGTWKRFKLDLDLRIFQATQYILGERLPFILKHRETQVGLEIGFGESSRETPRIYLRAWRKSSIVQFWELFSKGTETERKLSKLTYFFAVNALLILQQLWCWPRPRAVEIRKEMTLTGQNVIQTKDIITQTPQISKKE